MGAPIGEPGQGPTLELEEFELTEERVITATRFEQRVTEAPAIVQIFSARRFRELGIETVADALALVSGVFVRPWRTSQWSAVFRGTLSGDNNKFLLLVDGVPWRDGVYGFAWIDRYLALTNVRQIEVIRGPGSALYGSNAFAGVVNVITKRGEHLQGVTAGLAVGSFWRQELWANGGELFDTPLGKADVATYFRLFDEAGDGPPFSSKEIRRIGAKDPHGGLSGGFRLSLAGLTLKWDTVSYRHARFDGGVNTFRDVVAANPTQFNYNYLNHFLDLRYDIDLPGRIHLQPRVLFQRYDNGGGYPKCASAEKVLGISPNINASAGSCTPDSRGGATWEEVVEPVKQTQRLGAGLEVQHSWAEINRLVLGFEWESEQILEVEDAAYVSGTYVPNLEGYRIPHTPLAIHDLALYLQDTVRPFPSAGLGITAGARLGSHRIPRWNDAQGDFDTQTFNHFSPRAGLVYSFDAKDRWVAKLLYGQAYRAPTARELLLESSGEWTSGDPTLQPEEIRTLEAEITLRPLPYLTWVTSGYLNLVEDEITEDGTLKKYMRSDGFTVRGIDTEVRVQGKGFDGKVNFSFTDALDRGADLPQYGVPAVLANAAFTYRLGEHLAAGVVGHYVGTQPRAEWRADKTQPDGSAFADGEPFADLDLHLSATGLLGGKLTATLSATNVLDQPIVYILEKDRSASYYNDYRLNGRAFLLRLDSRF